MVESACSGERLVSGPAAYYLCLAGQLRSLNPRSSSSPRPLSISSAPDTQPSTAEADTPAPCQPTYKNIDPTKVIAGKSQTVTLYGTCLSPGIIFGFYSRPEGGLGYVPIQTTSVASDHITMIVAAPPDKRPSRRFLSAKVGGATTNTPIGLKIVPPGSSPTEEVEYVTSLDTRNSISKPADVARADAPTFAAPQTSNPPESPPSTLHQTGTDESSGVWAAVLIVAAIVAFVAFVGNRRANRVKCPYCGSALRAKGVCQRCATWNSMAGEEAARRAAEEEQRRQAEYRRGQEEEAGRRKNERQGTNREQDRQDGTKVPRDSTRTDPYAVLGLRPGATKDEIRAAYRNLIAKYHPDKVAHLGIEFQEIAKTKALELNRAYEILHR